MKKGRNDLKSPKVIRDAGNPPTGSLNLVCGIDQMVHICRKYAMGTFSGYWIERPKLRLNIVV